MADELLSYELHTGQELDLMISGKKPLAYFYDDPDLPSEDEQSRECLFDGLVQTGQFKKGEVIIEGSFDPRTGRRARIRYILYSTADEQWRIPAMIMVKRTLILTKKRPDEGLDRLTGSLLGYSDAQNDEYISRGECY